MGMETEMTDDNYIEKIISGSVGYCNKQAASLRIQGYQIVKQIRCADGKYTYVLRAPKRW